MSLHEQQPASDITDIEATFKSVIGIDEDVLPFSESQQVWWSELVDGSVDPNIDLEVAVFVHKRREHLGLTGSSNPDIETKMVVYELKRQRGEKLSRQYARIGLAGIYSPAEDTAWREDLPTL